MKRLGLATLALLTPAGVAEAGEFTANVSMVSDYVFRGISLTDGSPAIQGGFDWVHDDLFYAGTWASNVTDGVELDLYAGVTPVTGPITWDFAITGYFYPGAEDEAAEFDYTELSAAASFSPIDKLSLRPAVYFAPDNYGETGEAAYIELSAAYAATDAITLSGAFGSQSIEDPDGPFGSADQDEYATWHVGAAYEFSGFSFDLRYHDNDIDSGSDIETYTYGPDSYESTVVFSIGRAF